MYSPRAELKADIGMKSDEVLRNIAPFHIFAFGKGQEGCDPRTRMSRTFVVHRA